MSKKRILHVYNVMNVGGAETFIMNVFRKIDKSKINFEFLCISQKNGTYDEEIKSLGGVIHHIENLNIKKPISLINKVTLFLKENGPFDAIHLPIQFYSGIFCICAKKAGIKKIIVHSHSASDKITNNPLRCAYLVYMRHLINKYATIKLACGKDAGNFLFGSNSNFKILYNGIDLSRFNDVNINATEQLKRKLKINNETIIGHIGRFSPVKNHSFFITLANQLKFKKVNFKILLVGNGQEYENFKEKIRLEKLSDYFILAGQQQQTEIYYSLFDVLVMPSLYEGFPVTIVEAMASGLNCVVSDRITKEVDIIKNRCTFLSLNDDINTWCNEIIKKAKKNNKKTDLNILKNSGFSIETTTNKLFDLYTK